MTFATKKVLQFEEWYFLLIMYRGLVPFCSKMMHVRKKIACVMVGSVRFLVSALGKRAISSSFFYFFSFLHSLPPRPSLGTFSSFSSSSSSCASQAELDGKLLSFLTNPNRKGPSFVREMKACDRYQIKEKLVEEGRKKREREKNVEEEEDEGFSWVFVG